MKDVEGARLKIQHADFTRVDHRPNTVIMQTSKATVNDARYKVKVKVKVIIKVNIKLKLKLK